MRSQVNIHLYKLNGDSLSNLNKSLFTSEQDELVAKIDSKLQEFRA